MTRKEKARIRILGYATQQRKFKPARYEWLCTKTGYTKIDKAPCKGCETIGNNKCIHLEKCCLSRGVSQALREKVYKRDGYACIECGSKSDLTIDHLRPIDNGGTSDEWNLATMCKSCNEEKGNKLISKYLRLAHLRQTQQ